MYEKKKKLILYGAASLGFGVMTLNYTGVSEQVLGSGVYPMIQPLLLKFQTAVMNCDEVALIFSGLSETYNALISAAGTIVYGKKMFYHMKKDTVGEDSLDTGYHEIIKKIGV